MSGYTNVKVRMYNAGLEILEAFHYSVPATADMADDPHCVARHTVRMPEESWFEVPTEMPTGYGAVRVSFHEDILKRFGHRQVILLDASRDAESIPEEEPVAATEKQAIGKGKRRWQQYLRDIAEAHLSECDKVRAAGNSPLPARGFTKHALRMLGIADPGIRIPVAAAPASASPEVEDLKALVKKQGEQIEQLLSAQRQGGGKQQALGT